MGNPRPLFFLDAHVCPPVDSDEVARGIFKLFEIFYYVVCMHASIYMGDPPSFPRFPFFPSGRTRLRTSRL